METFQFALRASWQGGRLGEGRIKTRALDTAVSVPAELGGPGAGTNPEELLLAAAANCYMIALASLLERKELGAASFECTSEGTVVRDGGRLQFRRIVHRPVIVLDGADEARQTLAKQCAARAEKACMISQALKGNVEVTVEPQVIVNRA